MTHEDAIIVNQFELRVGSFLMDWQKNIIECTHDTIQGVNQSYELYPIPITEQ